MRDHLGREESPPGAHLERWDVAASGEGVDGLPVYAEDLGEALGADRILSGHMPVHVSIIDAMVIGMSDDEIEVHIPEGSTPAEEKALIDAAIKKRLNKKIDDDLDDLLGGL